MLRRYLTYFLVINGLCIGAVVASDKLIPNKVRTVVITPQQPVIPQPKLRREGPWVESPWDPPEEFVYHSSKYSLEVQKVEDANKLCRVAFANIGKALPPANWRINACSINTVDRSGNMRHCQIIMPLEDGTLPAKKYKGLFNHELAHCNGWKHP